MEQSAATGPRIAAEEPRLAALTIAGFDPSSGAGATADLKVFAAHGIYGLACLTALTVQSTLGVRQVHAVAPALVRETLECLAADIRMEGVKLGMLASSGIVREVAKFLARLGLPRDRVVLDPVLRSSSGAVLLEPDALEQLRAELLPHVGWITPNPDELAALAGPGAVEEQAETLASLAPGLNVAVTRGDAERPDDYIYLGDGISAHGRGEWLRGEKVQTHSTHGTGCAYSTALLCALMESPGPATIIPAKQAKRYVEGALRAARPLGHGKGPMEHFWEWQQSCAGDSRG